TSLSRQPLLVGPLPGHSRRSRTLYSSFQRCLPSRLRHQTSSCPTSVTLLCRWTGTTRPSPPWPSSDVLTGLSSSISPCQSSTNVPAASWRRTVEPRNRNSTGSPTTSPNSCPGTSASVPSSIPNGATHSALSGGGAPGTAGSAVSTPM